MGPSAGMRAIRLLALSSPLVMAVACGPLPSAERPSPGLTLAEIDPIAQSLVASAERTSSAIARLSEIESARTPVADPGRIVAAPPGMDLPLTVSWVGPLEPLIARLANAAGYQFRTVGQSPSVPIIVDVNATDERIVDIMREVGFQSGARAVIAVDVELTMVEVQYAQ